MRVAYCVVCHRRSKILDEMIDILGKDNDIYIHVDKKSNINDFIDLSDRVKLIKERVNVQWAGFTLVKATLNLLSNVKDLSLITHLTLPTKRIV